jgi:hypothetical protein
MFNFLLIVFLFIVNILFIYLIKKMKNNIASGVDLVLIGTLLTGYWFGWQWGFIAGILFRASVYAVTLECDIGMVYAIPCVGIVGIVGAIAAGLSFSIFIASVVGVITYMLIYFSIRIFLIGDNNYIMIVFEILGLILVNVVIFRFFV